MAIALALACVGIPLVGPWLARWAAAQERERLILAQLQRQAEEAMRDSMERMNRQLYGDQHGRLWSASIEAGPPLSWKTIRMTHRAIESGFTV